MSDQGLVLRSEHGHVIEGSHWSSPVDAADDAVLDRCRAPVLDIGCGPGRHVLGLAARGLPALGIDLTPHVVGWARRRGALVLERCVFERVPGHGRWPTALLLDGNIGIGGDPRRLLRRVADLVTADGVVLVEVDPPGRASRSTRARLELLGREGPWFAWSAVSADDIDDVAAAAGLAVTARWSTSGRRFAELRRPGPHTST